MMHVCIIQCTHWTPLSASMIVGPHETVLNKLEIIRCRNPIGREKEPVVFPVMPLIIPRLIARIPRFSHISIFMTEKLHWLPLSARIHFKIIFLVYKAFLGAWFLAIFATNYAPTLCNL